MTSSSTADNTKPTIGENNSAWPISMALPQSTPEVPSRPRSNALATPTPDRADHRVGARSRQAEPPGAEVPDDRRDQQREDHGKTGAAADLKNKLDRKQRYDSERHRAAGKSDAEKIEEAGPQHGGFRRQRMGVDHRRHGIGRIVKAVHELEAE